MPFCNRFEAQAGQREREPATDIKISSERLQTRDSVTCDKPYCEVLTTGTFCDNSSHELLARRACREYALRAFEDAPSMGRGTVWLQERYESSPGAVTWCWGGEIRKSYRWYRAVEERDFEVEGCLAKSRWLGLELNAARTRNTC